jgi:hypothetical protein
MMKKVCSLLFVAFFITLATIPAMAEGDPMPPPHRPLLIAFTKGLEQFDSSANCCVSSESMFT